MRIAVEEFTRTIATVSKQSPADRCRAAGLTPDQSDAKRKQRSVAAFLAGVRMAVAS